jgi:hypothetical protein
VESVNTQTTYAKIENNTVTAVHVVSWQFLVENPERYGNPDLYLECFQDGSGRGYCAPGWIYDAINDSFYNPNLENVISVEPE